MLVIEARQMMPSKPSRYPLPETWGEWEVVEEMCFLRKTADPQERMQFWKELNDYAVSQRGEIARKEFRLVEERIRVD